MTTPPLTTAITRPSTTSRYADPRTAAAPRSTTTRRRARVRTTVAAPRDLYGSSATAAIAIAIAPRNPVTDAANQLANDPHVPTRIIDGTLCTTRAGIAHLAGWSTGVNLAHRSRTDPDFPTHLGKIGRDYWYPLARVDTYLAALAERAAAKRPPAVQPGDPDDELHGDAAAEALHIRPATLRSYVRYSIPYWTGERHGRPLLPPPDIQEEREHTFGPYTHRSWYRRTLAQHQQQRPGPGRPMPGR